MSKYSRITEKERYLIEQGILERKSVRRIAYEIGRPPKTVSLEVRRNGGRQKYYAVKAHFRGTTSPRRGFSKIDRNEDLRRYIMEKLKKKWSPERIAGRWNDDHPINTISVETIYRWIYAQKNGMYLYLTRKKKQRGKRPQRPVKNIENLVSIDKRPDVINNRDRFGDCEGDLMFQRGNQSQNFLTVIERKSRMVFIKKNDSKQAEVILQSLQDIKNRAPFSIQSFTFDRGSEFAKHSALNLPTFFCHPGSPWQKGAIENINGVIRQHLDFRVDPNTISQDDLDLIAHQLNNTPRKILNFLTPYEVIKQHLQGVKQ